MRYVKQEDGLISEVRAIKFDGERESFHRIGTGFEYVAKSDSRYDNPLGGHIEFEPGTIFYCTPERALLELRSGTWFILNNDRSVQLSSDGAFQKGYALIFDFGIALLKLKAGGRVARIGWNGKNMWICMMGGLKLPPFNSQEPGAKVNDRTAKFIGPDTPLDSQPYIAMWNAQGKWQPGWAAAQSDMLAEDWVEIAEGPF